MALVRVVYVIANVVFQLHAGAKRLYLIRYLFIYIFHS
jgi:hypothetical protein